MQQPNNNRERLVSSLLALDSKRNSSSGRLSREFLHEYFDIVERPAGFQIEVEEAAHFLAKPVWRLKRRLIKDFTPEVDYTQQVHTNARGLSKLILLLTVKCFKLLGMSCSGENAEKLRT